MTKTYSISREIGIDAGHRVSTHGSVCANLHGHRYRILAHVVAIEVQTQGVQAAMVVDFGFLKHLMKTRIDHVCDHGMIMYAEDPWLPNLLSSGISLDEIKQKLAAAPHVAIDEIPGVQTKLCVVPFVPTAEKLAEWWFGELAEDVVKLSHDCARLHAVEVWETPNCQATFSPGGAVEELLRGRGVG